MKIRVSYLVIFIILSIISCKKEMMTVCTDCDLSNIPYKPVSYNFVNPPGFPQMNIPVDNPLTVDGVQLGRFLFYDPILSKDSTIACASCHKIEFAFTDGQAFSKGVNGTLGTRSSMSLLNIGYAKNGLFWDGRAKTLEDQALQPIENPIEMKESWVNVEKKLQASKIYREMFRKAFGILDKKEISKELAAKAISQFERTLLSFNSRFDKTILTSQDFLTDQENTGYDLYFNASPDLPDAQCGHCHNGPTLTNDHYFNNGIDSFAYLKNYVDLGKGKITGDSIDYGKFRAPSLRNIAQTAPYMHDGRFKTLDEVMNHYTEHVRKVKNLDANLVHLKISEQQKQDVLVFLKTLEDTTYRSNPSYKNPFK